MKKSKNRIKRISLSLSAIGLVAAPIALVACGSDNKSSKVVDTSNYQMPSKLTFIGKNGAGEIQTILPTPPTHTHLEYKVNDNAYSSTQPTTLNNNDKVFVNLVANTGYTITTIKQVLDQVVLGLLVSVDTSNITMPSSLTFSGNNSYGIIATGSFPDSVTNTHWEFKVNDSAYSSTQPTTLNNDDKVSIKLVANSGYFLSSEKELLDQLVSGLSMIVDTSNYIFPSEITYIGDSGSASIDIGLFPTPPIHSHLEYQVLISSGDVRPFTPTQPTDLENGYTVTIKLFADSKYSLSEEKERNYVVDELIVVVDTSDYVLPQGTEGANSLSFAGHDGAGTLTTKSNAPEGSHWLYGTIEAGVLVWSETIPYDLSNGDQLTLKLVADDGYRLSNSVENTTTIVKGLELLVDTSSYQMPAALTFTGNSGAGTIETQLPTPPIHTHLEYKVNYGAYSSTNPTTLNFGDKVSIRLVADDGYYLSEAKELLDQTVYLHN